MITNCSHCTISTNGQHQVGCPMYQDTQNHFTKLYDPNQELKDTVKQLSQRIAEIDTLNKLDNKNFETYQKITNVCLNKINEFERRLEKLEK